MTAQEGRALKADRDLLGIWAWVSGARRFSYASLRIFTCRVKAYPSR